MESKFTGGLWGLIGLNLAQFFLVVLTLGLASPWTTCMKKKWYIEHTVLEGCRLEFDGRGFQLLGNYIKWACLVVLTMGIFSFWLGIKMKKWEVKHTHLCPSTAMIVR